MHREVSQGVPEVCGYTFYLYESSCFRRKKMSGIVGINVTYELVHPPGL